RRHLVFLQCRGACARDKHRIGSDVAHPSVGGRSPLTNCVGCESLFSKYPGGARFRRSHIAESSAKWAQSASGNNSLTETMRVGKARSISLPYKDVMRSLRVAERESVPAGGGSSPSLPGGFGHHARRHYDRCVGCCHWTGTGDTG